MTADCHREDEIAGIKTAWELCEAGRRDKGEVR